MKTLLACAAMMLTGAALADIPPPPPEDPLGPDCQPFLGVWTPSIPETSRNATRWQVIAVGSEKASLVEYINLQDVNMMLSAGEAALTCTATSDGVTVLTFKMGDNDFDLTARLTSEASFTTERQSTYNYPGPPPADFKPETIVTTWTRIAR
jgi:hypothetical protein